MLSLRAKHKKIFKFSHPFILILETNCVSEKIKVYTVEKASRYYQVLL